MRPTPPELAELRRLTAASYHRDGKADPAIVARLVEAEAAHTANHRPLRAQAVEAREAA